MKARNEPLPVVILGAGLAGLSTAYHLGDRPCILVERDERVGGKARSERREGFTFDVTGHWLHVRTPTVQALLQQLFAAGDLIEIDRRTGVYTHGLMLPYPFQANLHGLPLELVQRCLVDFIAARERASSGEASPPRTLEEFAVARFGAGIAQTFFVPYNRKLWGVDPDRLTPDYVSRYIPIPDVAQVVGGAIGLTQEGLGYNARFVYPRAGGIDHLAERMLAAIRERPPAQVRLGSDVLEIDPIAKRVRVFGHGAASTIEYATLVTTLPLPELVARMIHVPEAVRQAASRLRSVPWRYLNVACRTPPRIPEHWVYVPEPHIPFFRFGIYTNAVPAMAPAGGSALYVELADRHGDVPLDDVIRWLVTIGAVAHEDDVVFVERRDVEHAYVLFDEAWDPATTCIHAWLDAVGVHSCGRYGQWIYNSMEDSIVQGMEAARWAEQP